MKSPERRHVREEPIVDPNLDRGWAWLILISALLTHILTFGLAYASVGVFYVELLTEFGQSEAATSWTGSILLGVMLCSGPISSVFVAKFGAMVTAITGGVFASSGLALSSLAPQLSFLYLTFGALTGFGFGLSYLPCIVTLGKFFERRRSLAYGIAVSGSGVGTFIFAPVTQYCIRAVGWRATFLILGCCCLLLCACGATYLNRKLPRKFRNQASNAANIQRSSSSVLLFFTDVTSVIAEPVDQKTPPNELSKAQRKEADVATQTVITCVNGERSRFSFDPGQYNTSNNATCQGCHCNHPSYNATQSSGGLDESSRQPVIISTSFQDRTDPLSISLRSSDSDELFQKKAPSVVSMETGALTNRITRLSAIGLVRRATSSAFFRLRGQFGSCLTFAHLLKNLFFLLFCLCNLLMCIGYQLPYMYFKAFALSLDISEQDWSYILSIMGITDMAGRIVVGLVFDRVVNAYSRLFGFMMASILSGVLLFLVTFSQNYLCLAILASTYSFLAGSTDSLVPALLAHFVGMDTLAYSFGMIIEMQGTGFLIGPPIAGALYRLFGGRYEVVFYTGGVAFVLAGLVLILQPVFAGNKTSRPLNCCKRRRADTQYNP